MSQDRNIGVTEASLGLSVIICLMVALGYWGIQRLGGPVETPPVEVRPSQAAAPSEGPIQKASAEKTIEQPQVLVAEQPDTVDTHAPHTAQRPPWPSDRDALEGAPIHGMDGLLSPITPQEDNGEFSWPSLDADDGIDRYAPAQGPGK